MIIAIGGPSNAGKSSLAKLILREYGDKKVVILCQDDFVYPENKLSRIREHIDWENPDTINFSLLQSCLLEESTDNDLVIVEGFMIFNNLKINSIYDKMIFIEIQEETFRRRKIKDLRWGREPDWYISHIWRQYQIYGQPPNEVPVLFLQGEYDWPIKNILEFLNK